MRRRTSSEASAGGYVDRAVCCRQPKLPLHRNAQAQPPPFVDDGKRIHPQICWLAHDGDLKLRPNLSNRVFGESPKKATVKQHDSHTIPQRWPSYSVPQQCHTSINSTTERDPPLRARQLALSDRRLQGSQLVSNALVISRRRLKFSWLRVGAWVHFLCQLTFCCHGCI